MAQLPTTVGKMAIPQSDRRLTRISTGASDQANINAARTNAAGLGRIAEGLGDISASLEKVEQGKQELAYQDARAKFLISKAHADAAFDEDTQWQTQENRYNETLGKTRGDLAAGITNPEYRKRFEADTAVDMATGSIGIRRNAREKEVNQGVASLNNLVQQNVDAAVAARDPADREKFLQSSMSAIDGAVAARYISPETAVESKRKVAQSYSTRYFETVGPETALTQLIPNSPQTGQVDQQVMLSNDAEILQRISDLERDHDDPWKANEITGAWGPLQIHPKTAAEFGLTPESSEAEYMKTALTIYNRNKTSLTSALGRTPTPGELYLAWQQGPAGAAALLGNPDKPAIAALLPKYDGDLNIARQAIVNNGGTENMTAGQFTQLWEQKFGGRDTTKIGSAMAGVIPEGGYDFSQPNGTPADFLPADVRTKLIQDKLKELDDQSKMSKAVMQTQIGLTYQDTLRNTFLSGEVDPVKAAEIAYAIEPLQAGKMLQELQHEATLGKTMQVVESQTLEQDQAMLAGAKLAADQIGPGSAEAASQYGVLVETMQKKWQAINESPVGYVAATNSSVASAIKLMRDNPGDKEALIAAVNMSIAGQQKLGLPAANIRALDKADAEAIVSDIITKPTPKQQFGAFIQFADTGNETVSRKLVADLMSVENGLFPGADIIADVYIETGNMNLAESLWDQNAAGSLLKDKDLGITSENNLEAYGTLIEEGSVASVLLKKGALAGNIQDSANYTGQVHSMLQNMARAIMTSSRGQTDYADAYSQAQKNLFSHLEVVDNPGAAIYYPKKYETTDPGMMQMGLDVLRKEFAQQFYVNGEASMEAAHARDIETQAVWTNGSENGFELMVPSLDSFKQPVSNMEFTATFEDVVAAGRKEMQRLTNNAMSERQRREGSLFMADPNPLGMVSPGNIDLTTRPKVANPDGGISTVHSMSYQNEKGQEVLIPTVSDEGKLMEPNEAIKYWETKGKNLGVFSNVKDVEAYAQKLHEQQAKFYGLE